MYTAPTYGGAPPYSMPTVRPGEDYVGLGFWSALIPIGTKIIGGLVSGDGDAIDKREYYAQAKSIIWCPDRSAAPLDAVEGAIANLGTSGAQLRQEITSQLASDRTWDELGIARPRGAREEAAVLINRGNGWRYCPLGETPGAGDLRARGLVDRVLAHEATRQRTLRERAQAAAAAATEAAATGVAQLAQAQITIIPGVTTSPLMLGAAALGLALLFRRR